MSAQKVSVHGEERNGYAFWRNAERRIDYATLDRIQQRSKGSRKKYSPR
jgi:hypothetical protein